MRAVGVRVVAVGLPERLTDELRRGRHEIEQATWAVEALAMLRRLRGPRMLVVSELLPGAGDLLAAVEADYVLGIRTTVVVVGDRTALALALRNVGVAVVSRRGAGKHVDALLRSADASANTSERLTELGRALAAASVRQVRRSQHLIDRSRSLCARAPGGAQSALEG